VLLQWDDELRWQRRLLNRLVGGARFEVNQLQAAMEGK
jgi:hypothetical protein